MHCDRAFKDFFDLVTETYEQHMSNIRASRKI